MAPGAPQRVATLRTGGRWTCFWGLWDEGVTAQPWRLKREGRRVSWIGSSTAYGLGQGPHISATAPSATQWPLVPSSWFAEATEEPEVNVSMMDGQTDTSPGGVWAETTSPDTRGGTRVTLPASPWHAEAAFPLGDSWAGRRSSSSRDGNHRKTVPAPAQQLLKQACPAEGGVDPEESGRLLREGAIWAGLGR